MAGNTISAQHPPDTYRSAIEIAGACRQNVVHHNILVGAPPVPISAKQRPAEVQDNTVWSAPH